MSDKPKRDQSKYKYARDKWRKNNPDYHLRYYKEVISKDPIKVAENSNRSRTWQKVNKDKSTIIHVRYIKKRLKNDPFFKFKHVTRSLIKKSFGRKIENKYKKKYKSEDILGCSLEFFKDYILSKCPKGTKLEDFHQFGYHIDHKIPLDSAKTEEDVIRLNHYTNLQPLWWRDNLVKSSKIL